MIASIIRQMINILKRRKFKLTCLHFTAKETRKAIEQEDPQPAATTNHRKELPHWLHYKIQNFQFFKLSHTTK